MAVDTFYYDNKIVKKFGIATVFWGIIGFLVGLTIALKLIFLGSHSRTVLWALTTFAHQCCDLCFCRECYFLRRLLFTSSFM